KSTWSQRTRKWMISNKPSQSDLAYYSQGGTKGVQGWDDLSPTQAGRLAFRLTRAALRSKFESQSTYRSYVTKRFILTRDYISKALDIPLLARGTRLLAQA